MWVTNSTTAALAHAGLLAGGISSLTVTDGGAPVAVRVAVQ